MAYEIDFIGVGSESRQDADAISFRWQTPSNSYKVAVYDGGLISHGEKLEKHLNKYYYQSTDKKVIDCVFCSHSDLDHVSGLKNILEKFTVKTLYMNRPWLYIEDIWDKVNDGRITKESLVRRLKEKYPYICELEKIASEKSIPIFEAFQGTVVEEKLRILSPSKDFYLQLLVESSKTPLAENNDSIGSVIKFSKKIIQYVKNLIETWTSEKLREDVSTSAENEMSVILLGEMLEENFLLTGDAGIRALDEAITYSNGVGKSIVDTVKFLQIPHHGGRHNVSPSILDRLIGKIVKEDTTTDKVAFVSVAKDSDHPLQMVVNAFTRRGVKVYKTTGGIIWHHKNVPDRDGFTVLKKLEFESNVEEWEK